MSHTMFDRLTRRTAFLTLGAVGLTGLRGATGTVAKNKPNKRHKKRKKEDPKKLCKKQPAQCNASLTPVCQGSTECIAKAQLCCASFGSCDPAGFLVCLLSAE